MFFDFYANVLGMEKTDNSKVPDIKNAEGVCEGQEVYLSAQYYQQGKASILEIPRYGWKVKEVIDGFATIEYQRRNLKLLMTLTVETRYLKKEA